MKNLLHLYLDERGYLHCAGPDSVEELIRGSLTTPELQRLAGRWLDQIGQTVVQLAAELTKRGSC